MFFMIHFLLVVSLYQPFSDFWKEGISQEGWYITELNENQKRVVRNSDDGTSTASSQEPSVINELAFPKYICDYTGKKKNKEKLFLRRIACLGRDGEIARAICCSDEYQRPWAIFLPMEYKIACVKPNCREVCYTEIIKLREKKYINEQQSIFNYDHNARDKQTVFNTEKKQFNNNTKDMSISSPTVAIPELILELIDLCNFINQSKLIQFEKLNSFCKMKNVNLDDFLNHVHYKSRTNYGLKKINSEIDSESEIDVDSFEPMSDKEVHSEKTVSTHDFDYYYADENQFEGITESKLVQNTAIQNKIKTFVGKPHGFLHNCTPNLNNNEEGCTKVVCTTKREMESEPDCFVDHSITCATENLRTRQNICKCQDEQEIIHTSSICDKVTEVTKEQHKHFKVTHVTKEHDKHFKVTEAHEQHKCHCNCNTRKKSDRKKKINKILQVLFHGPRPTFASKMNSDNLKPGGHLQSYDIPNTTPMVHRPSSILSYTVLKAVKSANNKLILRSYNPKESIKHYVYYINNKCSNMYRIYKGAQWEYETNINQDTRQKSMALTLEFKKLLRVVKTELDDITKAPLNDTNLQRQIKLLSLPGMDSLPEMKSNEFEQILYAMETIYSSAVVSKFNLQSEKISLNPGIISIMTKSVDPYEQKYYWTEWRKATGRHVRSLFEHYVSLMQLAAKNNGFHDASEMWTRQYESDDFIDMLSLYWEGVKPLYVQLHAYVRHKLHGFYGDVVGARDEGRIPAHLTGDIWCKNWKNLYSKVKPYKINDYMTLPLKKKMTPQRITKVVENLFISMGFTKLPIEFWDNSIFTKAKNRLIQCEPSAWDMGDGFDYRIKLCATHQIEDIFNIHNLITSIEYYKEYKDLPYAFRNPANPGFAEGIGEALVLSAHSKSHLKLFGINTKQSEKAEINKLMRIALEKIAFLPYSYILVLWRHKVFTGEINVTNYNSEWWKLRSEYQGVYPPVGRTEDDFDVGCKQHIVANQPYIKYFLSTILQFQFHESLCRQSDYQGPLHECDITCCGSTGKILRKAMSMGSSRHWKDVMEILTGARKIDIRPMLRYFEPLMKWLEQQNKETNVPLGWKE